MRQTTIILSDESVQALKRLQESMNLSQSDVVRFAVSWLDAMRSFPREHLVELRGIYLDLTDEQILAKLVSDDRLRRENKNTKENGIIAIKEDTTRIREIVEREFGDE